MANQLKTAQELAAMLGMPAPQAPETRAAPVQRGAPSRGDALSGGARQAGGGGEAGRPAKGKAAARKSAKELYDKFKANQEASPEAIVQKWLKDNMAYASPGKWGVPIPGMIPANAFGPQIASGLRPGLTPIGVPAGSITPEVRAAALSMQPTPEQISQEALLKMYMPQLQSLMGKVITAPQPVGAGMGGIPVNVLPQEILQAAGAQAGMVPRMYFNPDQLSAEELSVLLALRGQGSPDGKQK